MFLEELREKVTIRQGMSVTLWALDEADDYEMSYEIVLGEAYTSLHPTILFDRYLRRLQWLVYLGLG